MAQLMGHHDTFRVQLAMSHYNYSHALLEPDSEEIYLPVQIGDIGFVHHGKFHHLFNALYLENHESNRRFGVPNDHKVLLPIANHIDSGILYPNNLCSGGVNPGGPNYHSAGSHIPHSKFSGVNDYSLEL